MKPLLCSLLGAVLVGLTARAAGLHSAVDPQPRGDQWWKERHETITKRATEAGEKALVIFVGDSITQGWEGEGKEVWANYYARRNAVNLGIGGDRTQHVLWRLDNGNLTGLKPKAAVVMIGTNNSNGEDNTPGQIADGVAAIVAKLRAKLPGTKILLLPIFPRGENFNAQRGKVLQVNQVLQKLSDGENVLWVDFGFKFVGADGLIPRDLMPDYLHLTPHAYGIWAESIEDTLSRVLGDERVKPSAPAAPVAPVALAGEWIWTIKGPDDKPVSAPLILEVNGATITGKFARGESGWLAIEDGKLNGNEFTWVVKRDRPDGAIMAYRMSGHLENGEIKGQAKTELNGTETTSDWSARRK